MVCLTTPGLDIFLLRTILSFFSFFFVAGGLSDFLELSRQKKLEGEQSGREKGRKRRRLPHACQYSNQSQFPRDGRGDGRTREHHYDNPQTPKNQDFKGGDSVPLRECETTSCSHLHLIRTLLPFNSEGVYTHTHTHTP